MVAQDLMKLNQCTRLKHREYKTPRLVCQRSSKRESAWLIHREWITKHVNYSYLIPFYLITLDFLLKFLELCFLLPHNTGHFGNCMWIFIGLKRKVAWVKWCIIPINIFSLNLKFRAKKWSLFIFYAVNIGELTFSHMQLNVMIKKGPIKIKPN